MRCVLNIGGSYKPAHGLPQPDLSVGVVRAELATVHVVRVHLIQDT